MVVLVNGDSVETFLDRKRDKKKTSEVSRILSEDHDEKKKGRYRGVRGAVFLRKANTKPGPCKRYENTEIRRYEFMEMAKLGGSITHISVKRILLEMFFHWEDVINQLTEIGELGDVDAKTFTVPTCSKYLRLRFPNDGRLTGKNMGVAMNSIIKTLQARDIPLITRGERGINSGYNYTFHAALRTTSKPTFWAFISPTHYKKVDTGDIIPKYTEYVCSKLGSAENIKQPEPAAVPKTTLDLDNLMKVIVMNAPPKTTINISAVGSVSTIEIIIGDITPKEVDLCL